MAEEEKKLNRKKSGSGRILRIYRKIQAKTPVFIRNLGARIDPESIFLCGNYKTGSSAIASLLAIGTRRKKIIDLFWRTPGSIKRKLLKKELSLDWYVHRYRYLFSKKIIKEPDLIFYIDQLVTLFPRGQFVFLLRDPRDNIRSILNRLKIGGNQPDLTAEQFENLPNPLWKMIMEGSLFGTRGDSYIATQALRWKRILELYEQHTDNMILLKYESFLEDKIGTIRALAEQLGLSIKADITPYLDRQYQPRGDHSQSWLEFYGRENLDRIESICCDKMELYGYPPPQANK